MFPYLTRNSFSLWLKMLFFSWCADCLLCYDFCTLGFAAGIGGKTVIRVDILCLLQHAEVLSLAWPADADDSEGWHGAALLYEAS